MKYEINVRLKKLKKELGCSSIDEVLEALLEIYEGRTLNIPQVPKETKSTKASNTPKTAVSRRNSECIPKLPLIDRIFKQPQTLEYMAGINSEGVEFIYNNLIDEVSNAFSFSPLYCVALWFSLWSV